MVYSNSGRENGLAMRQAKEFRMNMIHENESKNNLKKSLHQTSEYDKIFSVVTLKGDGSEIN
ncbi:hypothetical protein [Paenibacillus sp. FSL W7-1287]|uniref:hypothetical protein n=1 Tax=Paenibacillus sp. FSL W7-1287 TaxID=2954538 RepID=UPI0030F789E3